VTICTLIHAVVLLIQACLCTAVSPALTSAYSMLDTFLTAYRLMYSCNACMIVLELHLQRCCESTTTTAVSTGVPSPSQVLVTTAASSNTTDMIGSMFVSMQSGSAELLVFGRDKGTVPSLQRVSAYYCLANFSGISSCAHTRCG
jgi:hypothetical protein